MNPVTNLLFCTKANVVDCSSRVASLSSYSLGVLALAFEGRE